MASSIPFETLVPGNRIFCHQEFLEKLEVYRTQAIGKRASLLLQRLSVDPSRVHFKVTRGDNQGWRRSRLGGGGGNHFYAWWAPRGAASLGKGTGFGEAPEGAIFIRDLRHHDDHTPCLPQSLTEQYMPVTTEELRMNDFAPAPWTSGQEKFAQARGRVRLLKGHPGSGKTTALLNAADASGAERVLYVTFSPDLAAVAKAYFDKYCDKNRFFHVTTYSALLRQLLKRDVAVANDSESRRSFRTALAGFGRVLGPWTDRQDDLYDELFAHAIGKALPATAGRFPAMEKQRLSDKMYRTFRIRHMGEQIAGATCEVFNRLERSGTASVAERFFPELALAWEVGTALAKGGEYDRAYLDFDCIAVDECQDLTAVEAYVLVALAEQIGLHKKKPALFLVAGDEAQTVRPTDFEWGWLNDMLHHTLGQPAEFKLTSNLRSPRRIAMLVNSVWDLYFEVEKKDRPSGHSYASIDDDSVDQVFYCTAGSGEEARPLLSELALREGLALVNIDDTMPAYVSEELRPFVLSAAEVKGLDFHTVCILEGGRQLERIKKFEANHRVVQDIDSVRRRLAIDRLRVAVSRPTERLIWLDVQPDANRVTQSSIFLNKTSFDTHMMPMLPTAVLTALEEDQLDVEERVQRCMQDARQLLGVRPEMAWSRAQQGVALLGNIYLPTAVKDVELRNAAHLTYCEVCLRLAMEKVQLPAQLGRVSLWAEAVGAAERGASKEVSEVVRYLADTERQAGPERVQSLAQFMQAVTLHREKLPSWFQTVVAGKIPALVASMEAMLDAGDNPVILSKILPPFYEAVGLPDAAQRGQRLRQRAISLLLKEKRHKDALEVMQLSGVRDAGLEAECLEAAGEFDKAAKLFEEAEKWKEALACYRAIPDFDAAAKLLGRLPEHPAAESYAWLKEMRKLIDRRPDSFSKVMTAPEKKMLEAMMEQALGAARKKAAPKAAKAVKAPAVDPGHRRRLELYLVEHKERRYCDACLSTLARVPAVAIPGTAKQFVKEKLYWRGRSLCSHCGTPATCTGRSPLSPF